MVGCADGIKIFALENQARTSIIESADRGGWMKRGEKVVWASAFRGASQSVGGAVHQRVLPSFGGSPHYTLYC